MTHFAHNHTHNARIQYSCVAFHGLQLSDHVCILEPCIKQTQFSTVTDKTKTSRFTWLNDVSDETISQLLVLAKLAYDGTKQDQLIFHDLGAGGPLKTLGRVHSGCGLCVWCTLYVHVWYINVIHVCVYSITIDGPLMYTGLLQEVPELYLETSKSYHFLHKTVQEFMAALYVSTLSPGERGKIVRTSFDEGSMRMVMRFMAGLNKFQTQDDMKFILALQEKDGKSLLESLHWLFEAHDPGLVQKCMGDRKRVLELNGKTLDPFDCYVLGYCIANSRQPCDLVLWGCSINAECVKMLTVVEKGRAFDYIRSIDLVANYKLGDEGAKVLGELYCTLQYQLICKPSNFHRLTVSMHTMHKSGYVPS